jgi:hypothetical protein
MLYFQNVSKVIIDIMKSKIMGAFFLAFISQALIAQDCKVTLDSLIGKYIGDCKNGKANGKGVANGAHSYTGEFKNGLPDGKGKYFWPNGDWYEGDFKKGMKDGEGILLIADKNNVDSSHKADRLLKGWWKKNKYIGKYEKPFKILFKSPGILDFNITFIEASLGEIRINTKSTSGGANVSTSEKIVRTIDNVGITGIDILSGNCKFRNYSQTHGSATDVLFEVEYPFKVRLKYGSESVEVEFYEKKEWTIQAEIHQ